MVSHNGVTQGRGWPWGTLCILQLRSKQLLTAGQSPGAAQGEGDPKELGSSRQSHALGHLRHRAEICNQRGWCMKQTKTTAKRETRHQQVEIPQLDL